MKHLLLPLLLLTLLTAACTDRKADSRPVLTVSIEPLRYVVEAIAGPDYQVRTLMPQGASPETYEPTPRQMMELNRCEAVFRAGTLGFEQTRLPQMVAQTPRLEMTDLAEGIKLLPADGHSHGAEGGHESGDPHTWMSPENLQVMARNACAALCRLDTASAPAYRQRLAAFEARMDSLDAELRGALAGLQDRAFLIYHPALGYFARTYGLRQYAVEHDGKEPSAAHLQQLIGQCRAEGVRVVFISQEHTGRAAQRIAQETGAHIVSINPLAYDVAAQMREIAKALGNNGKD